MYERMSSYRLIFHEIPRFFTPTPNFAFNFALSPHQKCDLRNSETSHSALKNFTFGTLVLMEYSIKHFTKSPF